MRVMHIIPSAFEYFQDIKEEAFALADEIERLEAVEEPVESEISTVQYGGTTAKEKEKMEAIAPSKEYKMQVPITETVNHFSEYDIVHLHAPFMGGAGLLHQWKENNPAQPFVITYYRDVLLPDFFAYIFKWYNAYYLPKLFQLADAVTCFSLEKFNNSLGSKYLIDQNKLVALEDVEEFKKMPLTPGGNEVKLYKRKAAAWLLYQIYISLLKV